MSKAKLLVKWAIFIAIVGVLVAPSEDVSRTTKLITACCGGILLVAWLIRALLRWLRTDTSPAPAWDEIESIPPIEPEPPLKQPGAFTMALGDWIAKWLLSWKKTGSGNYELSRGELFDFGTRHTPKNPAEAMRWYVAAAGGDPTRAGGLGFAKLRIAEMYEDGEGVPRDLETAGRIYKTIPNFSSAMLHLATAHVEGRTLTQDYVEAYKLLLIADKMRCMNSPTRKEVEANPQKHRENRRHIRVRELMDLLESRIPAEQLLRANKLAREWWEKER